jgi:pimeloyl-ACP methyl ester carboxylesterase
MHLAQAGFPTLRFDYGGTGDSAGDADDASLADWHDDIGRAIDALRDRTGVESVCLAGLRLGASLALEVAVDCCDVAALILWEPIVSGGNYLTELAEQHRGLLWRFFDRADQLAATSSSEFLGFAVGELLRDELKRLNLLTLPPARAEHVLIVESHANPEIEVLRDRLRATKPDIAYQQIPSFAAWREDVDKGLVPDQVLRGIATWATEVLP